MPGLVLHNGVVRTLNPRQPMARAVVVEGDRIAYVGDDSAALASRCPDSRRVDLRGACVLSSLVSLNSLNRWPMLLALKTVAFEGAPGAGGSDFPVEHVNPLLGIYAAVTRQDARGQPLGGWRAEECLSAEDAVRSLTQGTAYAAFEDEERGMLAPGRLADLTVLDTDPFAAPPSSLLTASTLMSVVAGRVTYEAPHL